MTGEVVYFNSVKYYGFIADVVTKKSYFFHYNDILEGSVMPRRYDIVSCDLVPDDTHFGKMKCANVMVTEERG